MLGCAYLLMTVSWVYAYAFEPWLDPHDKSLECRILAVGHGGCAVVDLPSGEHLMYDAGGMGNPRSIADSISRSLWYHRDCSIDHLILSHSDWDHCSAVPLLSQRFPLGSVWMPPSMWHHPEESMQVLCRNLAANARQVRCVTTGDRIQSTPQATVRVLYPDARRSYPNDNASSVVLLIESAGHRILFTGDLEHEGVRHLTSEPPLDVDILMAPHHGSLDSEPQQICNWCKPEWVIVSGNLKSSQSALQNYRDCGAKVLHTAIHGSILIRFAENDVQVTAGQ